MNPEKRLIQIVTLCAVIVVLLHLLFAFWRVPTGWGVHALAFFPAWASVGAAALALVLLLPAVSDRGVRMLSRMRVPKGGRHPHLQRIVYPLRYALIGLLSVIPFYLLRVRVQTLGDGPLWVRELTGPAGRLASEPLTIYLVRLLYEWMQGAGWEDALRVYQALSWACGALYVFFALLAADAVGRDRRERAVLRLSLLTVGTIELFCGYAEHYAPLTVGTLVFLYAAWRYMDGQGSLMGPALVWGATFALHFSAAALLPSLTFLYFIEWRRHPLKIPNGIHRRERRDRRGPNGARKLPALEISACSAFSAVKRFLEALRAGFWLKAAAPPALVLSVLLFVGWRLGLDPRRFGTTPHVVPLWGTDPFLRPHALLSGVHLTDVLNEHLLVAPMGLVLIGAALLTVRDRIARSPHVLLLGSAAFFEVALTVLFNPELGAFRDWDALSPVAVPVVLLAGYLLTRCAEPGTQLRLAWVTGVVAVFHLVPWLYVNADTQRALARFSATLRDGARLSGHARGSGWDELRGICERLGREGEALRAAKASLEAIPRHPRYLSNVVRLTGEAGDRGALESFLKEVVARDPGFARARVHLATLYQEQGRFAEGEQEYRAALTADPGDASVHTGLGLLLYAAGRMEEGAAAFEEAARLDPQDPVPLSKLGIFYINRGQIDRGIEAFRRAAALRPDYAEARANLGIALYQKGRLDESEAELRGVLRADPNNGPAKNTLAMIHKDRGRLDEAIRLLLEVLEPDPQNRGALTNLVSVYFLKGDLERAARGCERMLEADPKDEWALYNLCALYARMGRVEEAERCARRYVEAFPDAPQARAFRGMIQDRGVKKW
jgi:tetratricopeptide (TPR) repeat protein